MKVMKKITFPNISLIILLLSLVISSCSKEETDIITGNTAYFGIPVFLSDKNGNDLLNPTSSTHVDYSKIKVSYKGEDFSINLNPSVTHGDVGPWCSTIESVSQPQLEECVYGEGYVGRYFIYIGTFNARACKGQHFTITWDDGTVDTFVFEKFNLNTSDIKVSLNGKLSDCPVFSITRK